MTKKNMRRVLIVGFGGDPHIERVAAILEQSMGHNSIVIFDPRSPDAYFDLGISNSGSNCQIGSSKLRVDIEEIGAVWWRLKPTFGFSSEEDLVPGELEFRESEWGAVYKSLPSLLSDIPWINDRHNSLMAANKPYQLKMAGKIGFTIPKTIISNNAESIDKFVASENRSIFKTLSNFIFPGGRYIFTTSIDSTAIVDNFDKFKYSPGIFQGEIDKKCEWRITIIDNEFFSIRIDSQNDENTKIDWRKDQLKAMYEILDIGDNLKELVRNFQTTMGLSYGAYDFIETHSGEFVFLECNPAGQWLWLENATGAQICSSMARALERRIRGEWAPAC